MTSKLLLNVQVSPNDTRSYRNFSLKNGLKVLLVQDVDSDIAAAAMDVNVGQFSDPEELPGLAHFCEHMLFLGTEKYPNENEYSEYLSKHGGYSNAFTDKENTDYHFQVSATNLEGALDRFAQFFIAPLFTASATERELKAVDSENTKNLQVDPWRLYQLLRTTSNSSHPFNKFGTGNIQTLKEDPESKGIDTRIALLDFHKKYYSANQMGLVIIAPQSLDTLEVWVQTYFASIENKQLDPPTYPGSAFSCAQVGLRRCIVPIKEMNKLELIFPMKSYLSRFEEKPFTYLSSLIGHESEGSILYVLKARSWANSLSAGPTHRNRDFDMFQVTIDLTEEGLDHVNEVVDIVFQYIDMLRLEGPNKAQYDEIAKVQNLNFRFQERSQPLNYAIFIATQLNKVPPQLVISAAYLMQKWCPELITEVLEFLTPKNMILHQISKAYENNAPQREKWYNTAYNEEQLADAFVNSWCHESKSSIMPSIHYPAPNSFVPENFDIFKDSEQSEKEESGPLNLPGGSPSLIVNTEQMRLWHHQDKKFNRPRATINVRLMSPVIFQMHSGRVLAEMFAFVVTEVVNAYSYFAEIAGMDFSISAAKFSIEGIFRGYNDKLATFAVTMLKELRNYTTTHSSERQEQVFRRVQARYRKRLLNFPNEAPYQHGMVNCDLATMNIACDAKAKLKTLEALQPADLVAFSELFFNNLFVEMLIAGNVTKVKAIETGTKIFKELKAKPTSADELHAPRHVSLPAGSSFYHEDTEENPNQPCGAINIFFQIGFDNHCSRKEFSELAGIDLALLGDRDPLQVIGSVPLRVKAATIFLVHLMREPMYDMLRTKETLGYIVHVGDCSRWGSIGVRFIIQADKASPKYMDNRVEAFIESYRKILTDLSEEQFNVNRNAILTNLLEKPKNLAQANSQFWGAITQRQYIFNRKQIMAAIIQQLTKQDVVNCLNEYIIHDAPHRRKFSFHIYGNRSCEVLKMPDEKYNNPTEADESTASPAPATNKVPEEGAVQSDGQDISANNIPVADLAPAPQLAVSPVRITNLRRFVRMATLFPSSAYTFRPGQAYSPP